MNKLKLIFVFLNLFGIFFLSFKNSTTDIDKIRENDYLRFKEFKNNLNSMNNELNKEKIDIKNLINLNYKLRTSYKKWEYLACNYMGEFIKQNVNPAPLPKVESNSFGNNILNPIGLQTIDEIINSDDLLSQKDELIKIVDKLQKDLNQISIPMFYKHNVLIAARYQIIRIFTLSATGFDAPGSNQTNSIIEIITSLETIKEDLLLFEDINKEDKSKISDLFNNTITYLRQNNDFNKLNRFHLLINHINPIFKTLYEVHISLGYETPDEIKNFYSALNYNSSNLFAQNALNSNFYLNVPNQFINENTRELGKLLFFDPILSSNNARSCASCHHPQKGFTDNLKTSLGFNNSENLLRNSPTLINSVFSDRYFHDLRSFDLTSQVEHVIFNHSEFNTNWFEIIDKLNKSEEYKNIFKNAFNDISITKQNIEFSLAVYVGSLINLNSKFDKMVLNSQQILNKNEQKIVNGFNLFMGKANCGTCHFAPIFNGTVPPDYIESESEVLGVPENPNKKKGVLSQDKGRFYVLAKEKAYFNEYSFKTPTIRNVELTFPYMHNGAYKSLEEVMSFYNKGGGSGFGINIPHQTLSTDKLKLSKSEIKDLIIFMKSLTDSSSNTSMPKYLPLTNDSLLNTRIVGGLY